MDIRKTASYSDKTSIDLIKKGKLNQFLQRIYNKYDQSHIREYSDFQIKLILEEAKKFENDISKVFIGGFSQGCMICLTTLLRFKSNKSLGGVIAIGGHPVYDMSCENHLTSQDIKRI